MTRKTAVEEVKPVPRWVTSWPDWFGIVGNIEIVPSSDYDALAERLDKAEALLMRVSMRFHEIEAGGGTLTDEEDNIWSELTVLLNITKVDHSEDA